MALIEELERQGNWLFRWRSYLPLLFLPVLFRALYHIDPFWLNDKSWLPTIYRAGCMVISFLGLAVRCLVIGFVPKGTSGRNTTEQRASSLNTDGIYSLVRHPLYLGNFLIFLGVVMFVPVWWLTVIFVLTFFLYYERIMFAEEAFLRRKYGQAYEEWADQRPAFWPRLSGWRAPSLSFSFRNILKREYPAFFAIVVAFTVLKLSEDAIAHKPLMADRPWLIFLLFGAVTYVILRTLKKKTRLLHAEGR